MEDIVEWAFMNEYTLVEELHMGNRQNYEGEINHKEHKEAQRIELDVLSNRVIGCALEVHRHLGPGLLEFYPVKLESVRHVLRLCSPQ
jgi:hypothetical protein